jgi:6-pyruvoyltetrahydropterin/6-carboxytetrahydropterin synthase
VRDALRSIVVELDHYMLLPTNHSTIQVQTNDWKVQVTFQDRRWEFPRGDCKLLPVENTTTELLARYIGRRLLDDLSARLGVRPEVLRIELDECYGQSAVCELRGE